jgi:hypothetical protein
MGNVAAKSDSVSKNNDVNIFDLLAEEQIADEPSDNERLCRGPVCDLANSLQQ